MHDPIPLQLLGPGAVAHVCDVVGRPDDVHRLHEMGLSGGKRIEMIRPGSPCIIRLDGKSLCFRSDDLLHVLVRVGEAT